MPPPPGGSAQTSEATAQLEIANPARQSTPNGKARPAKLITAAAPAINQM
jgi:hypothetical protein